MGKKNRERHAPAAGRRRPMIQLDGIGRRPDSLDPQPAQLKATRITGIGLLGAYQEDSAESDGSDHSDKRLKNTDNVESPLAQQQSQQSSNMDDQLAGFLAEINALGNDNGAGISQDTAKANNVKSEIYDPENFDPATQGHLLPEPWQACYDTESGYYYYWRTDTNEVQWNPPSPATGEQKVSEEVVEDGGVVFGPQLRSDMDVCEKEEAGDSVSQATTNTDDITEEEKILRAEEKEEGAEEKEEGAEESVAVHLTRGMPLVSYGFEDVDHSDASSAEEMEDEEREKAKEERETASSDHDGAKQIHPLDLVEDKATVGNDDEESEETDEDIARKYSLDVLDEDSDKDEKKESKKTKGRKGVDYDGATESEKGSGCEEEGQERRVVRRRKKSDSRASTEVKISAKESKRKKKKDRKKDKIEKEEVKEKDQFEVDMFAEQSLSEGEIKSDEEVEDDEHISVISAHGSVSSISSASVTSDSGTDSSDSDSEEEADKNKSMTYEDISSESDNRDTEPEDSGTTQIAAVVETVNDAPPSDGRKQIKHQSEDDMQDFVDMLLEEALINSDDEEAASKARKPDVKIDQNVHIEEALDNEKTHDQVKKDVDEGPLLKAEVFEHLKKGEKRRAETQEANKEEELRSVPVNDGDYKAEIAENSALILEKLGFLDITRKNLTNFQIMLIELETRLRDWREGALNSRYLVDKLDVANKEILNYEETAAPTGWSCHWDSNYKMYYYHNEATGESTWHYPDLAVASVSETSDQHQFKPPLPQGPEPAPSIPTTDQKPPIPKEINKEVIMGPSLPPELPPLPEEPAEPVEYGPAPPPPEEPASPPLPDANDGGDITALPTNSLDPYRARLKKKKLVQGSSETKDFVVIGYSDSSRPPPPPGEEDMPPSPWEDFSTSGAGSPRRTSGSQTASPSRSASLSPSRDIAVDKPSLRKLQGDTGKSLTEWTSTQSLMERSKTAEPTSKYDTEHIPINTAKLKKEKKRKIVKSSGIPNKKLKQVSSLVQKWQQVRKQVGEELAEESSEEEDPEVVNARKILEWQKEQKVTGRAAYNPNFEEIKGDWRERVRKARERRTLEGPT